MLGAAGEERRLGGDREQYGLISSGVVPLTFGGEAGYAPTSPDLRTLGGVAVFASTGSPP